MRGIRYTPFLFYFSLIVGLLSCTSASNSKAPGVKENIQPMPGPTGLTLQKSIQLPNVKGGFDLMAIDIKGHRLFVSAEDSHTVEVIDLQTAKPLVSLPGFNEPKWIFYRPENNHIYVATGGDGKVTELDGNTFKVIKTFSFKEACNNLRFDSANSQLFVGVGKTSGSLGIIDIKQDKIIGEIPLSGYLKQFEIDGDRIYVNLPEKNVIELVSLASEKVIADWPVTEAKQNVPMAIDRVHHRLFIACEPGKFIVYSTETGKAIQTIHISKNADGIYYDEKRERIYVSCGEGSIEVIHQSDADHYAAMKHITTAEGAGTSLFSPKLDKYILAVPQSSNHMAEIRMYQPVN